jgi:hypothetical protein
MFSEKCYYCASCTASTTLYKITENENKCEPITESSCAFIIDGSNQCADSCGDFYKLGNKCYRTCIDPMGTNNEEPKECKCNYFFIKRFLEEKLYIIA